MEGVVWSVSEEMLSPEELMGRVEREERVKEEYWEEQKALAEELKKQMMENLREAKKGKWIDAAGRGAGEREGEGC